MSTAVYGLATLVHLLFAWYLWRARRSGVPAPRPAGPGDTEAPAGAVAAPGELLFRGAVLATALWCGLEAARELTTDLAWLVTAELADWLRYALWLLLLLVLNGSARRGAPGPGIRWGVGLVLAAALAPIVLRAALGHVEAPPGQLQLVVQLSLPLFGLFLVERMFRSLGDDSRWHAKPMCLGLAIVFAYDVFRVSEALMFGAWDADTRVARGAVHMLAVPVLLAGARRRRDWIQRLQVSRAAAFHSVTMVLAGAYLLLLSAFGYYVRYAGGSWGRALQISLVCAALALFAAVVLSGSLRSRLRVFVGKHFFSYRYDYREEWLRFTAMLSAGGAPPEVAQRVVRGLASMVECPGGALWLRSEAGAPYTQVARWNAGRTEEAEPPASAFCRFLHERGWVVDLDEFRSSPARYDGLALPHWLLASSNAWLVVPLQAADELLGFVVLARPRTPIDLNWEVLDLLKTASRQAAGHLAQMQATEALLEARKFDAFNRMSAFVVHDLKNIVTQLSLMLKNAERLHDNPEFQRDMLLTVESSLEKMRRLMLQLREGAPPPGGARGVELEPLVQRLQALARSQGRALETPALERLATRGHEDRLERVLGHLVQNALDATPASGRVWVKVQRAGGQVGIEIGDTGSGMTEEFVQTRLFKPFSSTKGSGMGVGSYESAQYVRELGGSIQVASRPGEGTVLTVTLPLFEAHGRAELMRVDAG